MAQQNNTYGKVYQKILRSDKITWKGKIVYSMLTTYMNGDLKCWPSLRTLKNDLNLSINTIKAGICELVNFEILTIETGVNNANIYTLSVSRGDTLEGSSVSGGDGSVSGGDTLSVSRGDTKHLKSNITNNINIEFIDFWNLYNQKKGDKSACENLWNNLTDSERQKAIDTIPAFKASISDKQYRPFPEKYLIAKRWDDEIEQDRKLPSRIPQASNI